MSDKDFNFSDSANEIVESAKQLAGKVAEFTVEATETVEHAERTADAAMAASSGEPFLVTGLTVFALACIVGYYVVWKVTPALHSPLMGITNAISSVIIVGAIIALGAADASPVSQLLGFFAVVLASVNIFGGFIITRRMLHMFKKKG